MRRLSAVLIGMLFVGAACAGPGASTSSPSASATGSATAKPTAGPPIQLGMIDTLSGGNAQIGKNCQEGATIAVDQINAAGGVLGRPLAIVTQDEAPNTAQAVNALRTLNSQGIPFTFGWTSSSDALGAVPIAQQINSIVMGSHAAAMPLTTDKYAPNFVRIAVNDAMAAKALAELVHERFADIKTWNVFGFDYVTGHDQTDTFFAELQKIDPAVKRGKEVFFPLTATDLNSYISSMISGLSGDAAQKEGLFMATFGAGTFNLVKQGQPFNLFQKFKVSVSIAGGGFLSQAQQLGKDTPDMWSQYDYYYKAFDSQLNQQYVKDYQAKYNAIPGSWSMQCFKSIYAYKAAFEKAGGTEFAKVLKAFDDLTFKSIEGDVLIRAGDHQAAVSVVARHFKSDASAKEGFVVAETVVRAAKDTIPPVKH